MTKVEQRQAETILNRLESRRFAEWYREGGKFDTYITVEFEKGHAKHVSREEILEDIHRLFVEDL